MPYLVIIRKFKHSTDAYHYKSILKDHSIESYIETPDFEDDIALDANELSEANLSVLQSDVDDAVSILKNEDLNYFGSEQEDIKNFHGNELVLIKKMSVQKEAYLYKARLKNEEINCFIVDKHAINTLPLIGLTAETIELYVPKSDFEIAKKIIAELDANQTDEADIKSDYKPMLIILVIILIALFLLVQQFYDMY